MCYKQELQKANQERLETKFAEHNVPKFIRDYFKFINSGKSKLTYWGLVKDLLMYLIDNNVIDKADIAEITQEDLVCVTAVDVIDYLDSLSDNSNDTLNTKKNMLVSFWNYLVTQDIVNKNVVNAIPPNKFKSKKRNRAKKQLKMPKESNLITLVNNINNILDNFMRERNLAVVRVLRGTGLRESELVGLDIDKVNLMGSDDPSKSKRPYVEVVRKGVYDEEEAECVDLSSDALLALTEWLTIRNKINTSSKAVFVDRDGNRLTERQIIYFFDKYSEGTISPHMLRHYYSTVLYRETGHDHVYVQSQMGHASFDTTMTFYTGADENAIDKALNNI